MAKFIDISSWQKQEWQNTGGTRNKKYVQSPIGEFYYFKTSLEKEGKNYQYEFWSEIIAYEIGQSLGFNVLQYDIAVYEGKLGCLSKDMIDQNKEILNEGIRYLVAFDNTFNPNFKESRKKYDFQLIKKSLEVRGYGQFVKNIIEIIIFDLIIGNGDRHQENWAIISDNISGNPQVNPKNANNGFIDSLKVWYNKKSTDKAEIERFIAKQDAFDLIWGKSNFAPIYDSGSSLARECTEQKIINMLNNDNELESFITRGKSEIHWNNQKITHFELLNNLIPDYKSDIKAIISRIKLLYDSEKLKKIIENIDKEIPLKYIENKIPNNRKELIHKMITLRITLLLQKFL